MPDEVAWSHLGRNAWVNSSSSRSQLLTAILGLTNPGAPRSRWAVALAKMAGLSKGDYIVKHSMEGLLRLDLTDEGVLGSTGRRHGALEALSPFPHGGMACQECRSLDIQEYGFSWFRRVHQLPGIDICYEHDCDLKTVVSRTLADHIEALNAGQIFSIKGMAGWRSNRFVRRYREYLSDAIELNRPVDWISIRRELVRTIDAIRGRRNFDRHEPIVRCVMKAGADQWFLRHFNGRYEIPRCLEKVWGKELSAVDVALILSCKTP